MKKNQQKVKKQLRYALDIETNRNFELTNINVKKIIKFIDTDLVSNIEPLLFSLHDHVWKLIISQGSLEIIDEQIIFNKLLNIYNLIHEFNSIIHISKTKDDFIDIIKNLEYLTNEIPNIRVMLNYQ